MSETVGASYVMRAAGSHTVADLAAFFFACEGEQGGVEILVPNVWLIQCKRDGRLPAEEREQLVSLANEVGAVPMLAKAGPRGVPVVMEQLN